MNRVETIDNLPPSSLSSLRDKPHRSMLDSIISRDAYAYTGNQSRNIIPVSGVIDLINYK